LSVTIRAIAQHTGLSIPTVGNILGRSGHRYNPQTRARVLEAAKELGYRPNASARSVRNGRFGCAALILSRSRQQTLSHIPAGLLDGLDDELARHDMHLTVSRLTDEELSTESFLPKVLREHMADGMIVNYTHQIPQPMLDVIHAHHAPAVWLNAKLPEDCVFPDDFGGARDVTEQLLRLGHRRIALVHTIARLGWTGDFASFRPHMHYSVIDRIAGFDQAMRAAGREPIVLSHDRFIETPDQIDAVSALLNRPDRPTAIIAYSETEAYTIVCAARVLGLTSPRDLSIVVFAPENMAVLGLEVTAAAVPTREMGRQAVLMLMEKLKAPETPLAPVPVPYAALTPTTLGPPAT
jgi:LacI family transcriptional regulator